MAQKPRIHPSLGICSKRPLSRLISSVWYRSLILPAQKNNMPVIRPWATMPNRAALMPIDVSVEMPNMTKPMWATELKAMRRFMSVWARQPRAP